MAGGNSSKAKGSGAERALARILSDVFGGSFMRVPNSGAFLGKSNQHRRTTLSDGQVRIMTGDIIPPDHMPKLVIECKFYQDFRFHGLLQPGVVPTLDTWIAQALDGISESDVPFVVFKINLRGWYIVVPCRADGSHGYQLGNHSVYHNPQGCFIVTELKSFLNDNKVEIMQRCA
jgi:hypothetical protein